MQRLHLGVRDQSGQTTAEYATTLLVVVLVTGALAAFVKSGGLESLFDNVVRGLIDHVRG
jgi:Flp pilus assembly pilin Flp